MDLAFKQSSLLQSADKFIASAAGSVREVCLFCEPRKKSLGLAKSSHEATADVLIRVISARDWETHKRKYPKPNKSWSNQGSASVSDKEAARA